MNCTNAEGAIVEYYPGGSWALKYLGRHDSCTTGLFHCRRGDTTPFDDPLRDILGQRYGHFAAYSRPTRTSRHLRFAGILTLSLPAPC